MLNILILSAEGCGFPAQSQSEFFLFDWHFCASAKSTTRWYVWLNYPITELFGEFNVRGLCNSQVETCLNNCP